MRLGLGLTFYTGCIGAPALNLGAPYKNIFKVYNLFNRRVFRLTIVKRQLSIDPFGVKNTFIHFLT